MTDLMQQTRGTAAAWASADPVLEAGQLGLITDTGELVVGDGVTAFTGLTPIGAGGAVDSEDVIYDPTASGLASTDVQAALDEVAALSGGTYTGDPVDNPAEWGSDLGFDEEFNSGSGVPTGWAWVNQGTATYTRTKGRGLITEPTAASGNNVRLIERSMSGFPGTFEATFKARGRMFLTGSSYGSVITLRDSVSGKLFTFGAGGNPALDLWQWNSASALNTTVDAIATDLAAIVRFWRIKKNSSTSWDFLVSADGVVWDTIRSAYNVTTFLGTAPTHIGFGLWRNNQIVSTACDWFRVR